MTFYNDFPFCKDCEWVESRQMCDERSTYTVSRPCLEHSRMDGFNLRGDAGVPVKKNDPLATGLARLKTEYLKLEDANRSLGRQVLIQRQHLDIAAKENSVLQESLDRVSGKYRKTLDEIKSLRFPEPQDPAPKAWPSVPKVNLEVPIVNTNSKFPGVLMSDSTDVAYVNSRGGVLPKPDKPKKPKASFELRATQIMWFMFAAIFMVIGLVFSPLIFPPAMITAPLTGGLFFGLGVGSAAIGFSISDQKN